VQRVGKEEKEPFKNSPPLVNGQDGHTGMKKGKKKRHKYPKDKEKVKLRKMSRVESLIQGRGSLSATADGKTAKQKQSLQREGDATGKRGGKINWGGKRK